MLRTLTKTSHFHSCSLKREKRQEKIGGEGKGKADKERKGEH